MALSNSIASILPGGEPKVDAEMPAGLPIISPGLFYVMTPGFLLPRKVHLVCMRNPQSSSWPGCRVFKNFLFQQREGQCVMFQILIPVQLLQLLDFLEEVH